MKDIKYVIKVEGCYPDTWSKKEIQHQLSSRLYGTPINIIKITRKRGKKKKEGEK